MIAKRYFTALVILITLLGFYNKQNPVPNQEIELQFVDQEVVVEDTEDVIQAIKQQLAAFGITDIQVREQENGVLKIAYYSETAAADIKKILSSNGIASNGASNKIPTDKKVFKFHDYGNLDTFKLDVYELQTASNPHIGIHGKYILELQKEYDKSPSPNSFGNTNSYLSGEFKTTIAFVYMESNYIAIPKENISYEIPDVRAGPSSFLHS